jgi:hypothetical protein
MCYQVLFSRVSSRYRAQLRNVFWKREQTGTDKELIHASQFVDCPLLLLEAGFLLLSPSQIAQVYSH